MEPAWPWAVWLLEPCGHMFQVRQHANAWASASLSGQKKERGSLLEAVGNVAAKDTYMAMERTGEYTVPA